MLDAAPPPEQPPRPAHLDAVELAVGVDLLVEEGGDELDPLGAVQGAGVGGHAAGRGTGRGVECMSSCQVSNSKCLKLVPKSFKGRRSGCVTLLNPS